MKRIFFLTVCVLLSIKVFAQKDELTLDEHNKFIYYKVAEMPALTADTLYNRCLSGVKKDFRVKGIKPVLVAGSSIVLKSTLVLYNTVGLARHESGEVSYVLNIEFKAGRYRYWLSDLVFAPYDRNRYNVYERVPGVEVPFENVKAKYDAKTFDTYSAQIISFGNQLGDQFKTYATAAVKKEVQPSKTDTRKW